MNKRVLGLLSLGHLTVDCAGGALPALLPLVQSRFHLSYALVGVVVMAYNLTSSIIQPAFGWASDRRAMRWLLPAGVLLAMAGLAAVGVAPTYGLLIGAVCLLGIGNAVYHPEGSKSARYVVGRMQSTGMAVFSVGGNIGFALGPLVVAALLATTGAGGTWILIIPGVVVAFLVAAVLADIKTAASAHAKSGDAGPSQPWAMALLVIVVSLRATVHAGVYTFVPLYGANVLGRPATENSLLLFAFLAAGALGTIAAGPIADRFGKKPTLLVSFALAPPLLAAFLLVPGVLGVIALCLAGAFLIGTFAITLVMGQEFMPRRLALASSLMIGFTIGVGGVGVALLGRLADVAGVTTTLWALVALAAGSVIVTALVPGSRRDVPIAAAQAAAAPLSTS